MITPNKRPAKQNVLQFIIAFLVVSALLRVGEHANVANAQSAQSPTTPAIVRADPILGMPLDDQTLPDLLEAFKKREAELLEREMAAEKRAEEIALSAKLIMEQLAQLEEAEAKLAVTLNRVDTAAAEDLERLANVYENMKPRDTAALFTEMAPGFAAGFLGLMQPEAAAAIMTELDPQTAHLISVMLAGRNANAPMR